MKKDRRNLAASVGARLMNRARQTGDDYQRLLVSFCLERFLYRLGASSVHDRFVLKGAMLLQLWSAQPYRATRDLDLLRKGDGSFAAIRTDIETICAAEVEPDAVVFDPASIRMEAIRAEDEYAGTRVTLPARCGSARLMLQIDMGLGDSVWPPPQLHAYPALLDFPPPTVLAYPPEAVVAEKLEAMIVLGDRNSRIKDFFDLHYLASRFEFDRATLAEAVRQTFGRRHTPVPSEEPIGLTPAYWENVSRGPQIRAFARRGGLTVGSEPGTDILAAIRPFLLPILDDLRSGTARPGTWPPGGPWRSQEEVTGGGGTGEWTARDDMTGETAEALLPPAHRRFKPYPAYKNSGVEWLGEIPAHWERKRLKFVAPIRISKLSVKPDDTAYVGLEHVESWSGRLLLDSQPESVDSVVGTFRAGDVLFGKLRPYLAKAARPDFDGVSTSEILALRPAPGCSQSYVMYCLLNAPYIRWLDSLTFGTKMPRVSPEQVGCSFAPVPPEPEQRTIAAFLDREAARIDGLVAKKERLIGLLQEKRAALITRAVTKGLDPSVPMKDSGAEWLGQIPAHWEVCRLKDLAPSLGVGVVVNPSQYVADEGVPFLYGSDIAEGRILTDDARRISPTDSERLPKSRLHAGDLLMVRVGSPGVAAVVPQRLEGANCASVLVIRQGDRYDSGWLCLALNSRYVRFQVEMVQYGAAQEQFNVAHAVTFLVAVPSLGEQRQIREYTEHKAAKLDALATKVREAIERLKELRTALISAAVTGKIDVRAA